MAKGVTYVQAQEEADQAKLRFLAAAAQINPLKKMKEAPRASAAGAFATGLIAGLSPGTVKTALNLSLLAVKAGGEVARTFMADRARRAAEAEYEQQRREAAAEVAEEVADEVAEETAEPSRRRRVRDRVEKVVRQVMKDKDDTERSPGGASA